ncbi:hypothetical protein [Pseudoxanthomonas indica]|nr:hypothetical protein [Pseudoxanthomonas indica]
MGSELVDAEQSSTDGTSVGGDHELEHGLPVIGTPLVEEAARWELHIKLGLPYRTSYEARMRHFLALCARSGIRANSLQLVVAFRYGYWAAAGDPVAYEQQEMSLELRIRKQTFGRLVHLATTAWGGVERDDSCRVYPNYAFGAFSGETGTHTRNEDGDIDGVIGGWGMPDLLTEPYIDEAA